MRPAVREWMQVDESERHSRRACHRVRAPRAGLETAQRIKHAVHQFLGWRDVVDDLAHEAAFPDEHRRLADTDPQRRFAKHGLL